MHIIYDENGNPVSHGHEHEHHHDHEHHHEHDHAACDAQNCESGCGGCQDKTEGKDAAADQIRKAVDEFKKGNLYLGLALATVKEQ